MNVSRVAHNSLWLMAGQLSGRVLQFVWVFVAVRTAGSAEFGRYAVATTFFALASALADMGLSSLTVRDVAKRPDLSGEYLKHTLVIRSVTAVLAYLGIAGFALGLGYPGPIIAMALVQGLALIPNLFVATFSALYNAHEQMGKLSLLGVGVSAANTVVGLLLLWMGYNLTWTLGASVAVMSIQALVMWRTLGRHFAVQRAPLRLQRFKEMVPAGLSLMAIFLINIVYFRADLVLLSKMVPEEQVGWYSAIYRVINSLLLVPQALGTAILPNISHELVRNPGIVRQTVRKAIRYMALLALPLAAGATVVSLRLVQGLFGPSFAPAAQAFTVLCWAMSLMFFNSIFGPVLLAEGRNKALLTLSVFTMIANIGLNLVLIRTHGMVGAAFATFATEFCSFFVFLWLLRQYLSASLWGSLVRTALAALVMAGILVNLRWNVFVTIGAGALVYAVLLILLGVLRLSEVGQLFFRRKGAGV